MNMIEQQDEILAHVKTLIPDTPVYEDMVPDDESLPMDEEQNLIPYVVVRFGPLRPSYTGKSFGGPGMDEYWASTDIVAIAPTGRTARVLNYALVAQLIGWCPDGISPLTQRTDAGDPAQFVVSSNESRPTQYVASTRLRYTVNASGVSESLPLPA